MPDGEGCGFCRNLRTLLLAVLLGGSAGFAILAGGGSRELSMAATFLGAIAPVLWRARRERRPGDGSE